MVEHIGGLTPDPKNARRHTPRNLQMIENSLQQVGFARSIVIDENDVVLAGNGVLEAAGNIGIENLRILESDGNEVIAIRRSNLTDAQKQALALFDNRTAELALWDEDVIRELSESMDLSPFFYDEEMQALFGQTDDSEDDTSPQLGDLVHRIVIDCDSEEQQRELLERLEGEGYSVRALMS